MNKFEIHTDPNDPTMALVTFWWSPTNGATFRWALTDLQDLNTLINTYIGAQQ